MLEGSERVTQSGEPGEFVEFLVTGQAATGDFQCSKCGYGIVVQLLLPRCPMCSGTTWEASGWGTLRRRPTEHLQ